MRSGVAVLALAPGGRPRPSRPGCAVALSDVVVGAAFMRSLPQNLWSADDGLRDGIGLDRGPAAAPKKQSWSTHLFRLHRVQRRSIHVARRTRRAAGWLRSGPRRPVPGRVPGSRPSGVSTRVPLVECRSVTITRPSTTSTSAWVFDTDRAGSTSGIVAASGRPGSAAGSRPSSTGRSRRTSSPPGARSRHAPGCGRGVGASPRSTGGSAMRARRAAWAGPRSAAARRPAAAGNAGSVRGGALAAGCGRARRSVAAPPGSTRAAGR